MKKRLILAKGRRVHPVVLKANALTAGPFVCNHRRQLHGRFNQRLVTDISEKPELGHGVVWSGHKGDFT